MIELPKDLPIIERSAVRLVVLDGHQRVLLFHTRDPESPGAWWELPGGGIDSCETYLDAGVRELREETGFIVAPSQFGPANWHRRASFVHRRTRHLQDEVVGAVRLDGCGLAIDESRRLEYEREDYFGFQWLPVADIVRSQERFYPGRLPELLIAFLAGEDIHEPFELWS